jgi:hypothetical protein
MGNSHSLTSEEPEDLAAHLIQKQQRQEQEEAIL